jgi:glycosyltransferase involved in cell wall biosynthesis
MQAIEKSPSNVQINYKGILIHDEIAQVISNYHILLLPTKSESYGQSIAEALLLGKPVIISDQTPWTDVNDFDAGFALDLNKPEDFTNAIQKFVDMDNDQYSKYSTNAKEYVHNKLNTKETIKQYIDMFK